MENVSVCGVIRDFKSHRRYIAGLNASKAANREALRRMPGNAKEDCEAKKNHEHNRTGDDGLRSHPGGALIVRYGDINRSR